jgi:hypothetical protein
MKISGPGGVKTASGSLQTGENTAEFRGGPVIFQFQAGIPEVVEGIVVHGSQPDSLFKAAAGLFVVAQGKIKHPYVVPDFGIVLFNLKRGMVAVFGKFKLFKLVVDEAQGNPGFRDEIVDIHSLIETLDGGLIIACPLPGNPQIKPEERVFGLYAQGLFKERDGLVRTVCLGKSYTRTVKRRSGFHATPIILIYIKPLKFTIIMP